MAFSRSSIGASVSVHVGKVGAFLASPVAGGVAGVLFPKSECKPILEGQICTEEFNTELGGILTLVGWGLVGLWWLATGGSDNE
jgi:hypothetical protein